MCVCDWMPIGNCELISEGSEGEPSNLLVLRFSLVVTARK